jgi:hypothetical protein
LEFYHLIFTASAVLILRGDSDFVTASAVRILSGDPDFIQRALSGWIRGEFGKFYEFDWFQSFLVFGIMKGY